MHRLSVRSRYFVSILACCWLTAVSFPELRAQMSSVVNDLSDDNQAYPYDKPETEDIDESMDGVCEDAAGRCTLRAALDEAAALGVPANVTFSPQLSGDIMVDDLSAFYVPKGSKILGNDQYISIRGNGQYAFLMVADSSTTIQGLWFADAVEGIDVVGSGSLIGGDSPHLRNVFTGMTQAAVNLIGDNNTVQGNFIGLDIVNQSAGNQFGVFVSNSSRNTIGGIAPGEGNIISGNIVAGIALVGDSTETGLTVGGNRIIGNYIGTDSTGTEARPNEYGILVTFGHAIAIGGPVLGEANVISGNTVAGISLGPRSDTVRILANTIGTDVSGVFGLPNRTGVILGPGSSNCTVEGNLISSNQWEGISVTGDEPSGLASTHHRISGNNIVLNGISGITLTYEATDIVIGSSLTQNFPQNKIQYNGQGSAQPWAGGVTMHGYSGLGIPRANTIRKNDFLDNAPRGIRFDDPTAGVQDDIQRPVITVYTVYGDGTALVTGTHHRPGSLIDVYAAGSIAGPTFQGRQWLASGTVDGNGDFNVPMDSCTCGRLIAIATDAAGNSSEFSLSFETMPTIVTADLSLNSGWNMVSVPLTVNNFQTSTLFPGSTVGAYAYSGGSYTPAPTLAVGSGYWVRYPGPATVSMQGTAVQEESVAVAQGWNLIGSISANIAAASLASVPGGLVTSSFYEYDLAYEIADTIRPGKAYWVKAQGSGTLILSPAQGAEDARRIVIRPGAELPPPPPSGQLTEGAASGVPAEYRLERNFPNPFNPVTEIRYQLPEAGRITLRVLDILGREVAVLVDGYQTPGIKSAVWDAQGMGSGVYICELVTPSFRARGRMLLVQ